MRQYLVLKADQRLREAQPDEFLDVTLDVLRNLGPPKDLLDRLDSKNILLAANLSEGFRWHIEPGLEPAELVAAYNFTDFDLLRSLREFLFSSGKLGEITKDPAAIVRNIGADPVIRFCSHVPVAQFRPFGNRSRTRELMGIADLRDCGLEGHGVNVVIIDRGLNRGVIEAHNPESWGGGLVDVAGIEPGSAPPTSHGMLIARNILDVAPKATLYDVPLIPPHISLSNAFASDANMKFRALIHEIRSRKQKSGSDTAWILVNAWAVFDRAGEVPHGDYTANGQHPLNKAVTDVVDEGIDVVFGSGNCGQFTPLGRCGRHDRGPGNSIWGANAHQRVLTVGAVSADDAWMGYSSEGPAPWGDALKPDVCAPSHFYEDHDPSMVNSGTSAATALASGVVAAIRSNASANWGPVALPPDALKSAINASARRPKGGWNARTGHGIIDAGRLLQHLGVA